MKANEIKKLILTKTFEDASKIIEEEFKEKTNITVAYCIAFFAFGFLVGFILNLF